MWRNERGSLQSTLEQAEKLKSQEIKRWKILDGGRDVVDDDVDDHGDDDSDRWTDEQTDWHWRFPSTPIENILMILAN